MVVEAWAAIAEAPSYEVSDLGRVRRVVADTMIDVATWPNQKGYIMASLELPSGRPALRYVHRLVLEAFRGRDARRPIVNHDDLQKGHNALDNLTWSTTSTNVLHGRRRRAELAGQRSLLELLSA
jgi:hypothetical protein